MREVLIYRDSEDGGWIAEVPSLPGCVSQGETKDEVLANIQDAIEAWLHAAGAVGVPVPADLGGAEVRKIGA
jgi:predicted RNase H-like HicB family nuclease